MTLPDHVIEAGAEAYYNAQQRRFGFCGWTRFPCLGADAQQGYRDAVAPAIQAGIQALWQPIESQYPPLREPVLCLWPDQSNRIGRAWWTGGKWFVNGNEAFAVQSTPPSYWMPADAIPQPKGFSDDHR